MTEKEKGTVLCAANSYIQKYYFNPDFERLPQSIKDELKILCVSFTEAAGGVLTLEFDRDGHLQLLVQAADGDFYFDEIESGLRISTYQRNKAQLFSQLELFYRLTR